MKHFFASIFHEGFVPLFLVPPCMGRWEVWVVGLGIIGVGFTARFNFRTSQISASSTFMINLYILKLTTSKIAVEYYFQALLFVCPTIGFLVLYVPCNLDYCTTLCLSSYLPIESSSAASSLSFYPYSNLFVL